MTYTPLSGYLRVFREEDLDLPGYGAVSYPSKCLLPFSFQGLPN